MAEHARLQRRQFLHPHLIVKRWGPFLLFTVIAMALSAAADPKLFETMHRASMNAQIGVLLAVAVGTHIAVLAIVWFMLETRYVVAVQTAVATVTFLVVLTAASVVGFWARMAFLGDSRGTVRLFGPTAYTLREGLAAAIALTVTGSAFSAAYNFAFQRKANYAPFNRAQTKLLAHIAAMRAAFDRDEALGTSQVSTLRDLCKTAVDALPAALAEEEHAYRTFVDAAIGAPLAEIRRLAERADVAANPADFLRACGLARPSEPWDSSFVATMTAAYQQLEATR